MSFCVLFFFFEMISNSSCENWSCADYDEHYPYLYKSWFMFIFKVAVMLVLGCSKVHYWSSSLINRSRNRNDCTDLMKDVNAFASAKTHTFLYVIYIFVYIYISIYTHVQYTYIYNIYTYSIVSCLSTIFRYLFLSSLKSFTGFQYDLTY